MIDSAKMPMSAILKVAYKRKNYPGDMRKVVACGTYDNKVRVEWTD